MSPQIGAVGGKLRTLYGLKKDGVLKNLSKEDGS